MALDTPRLDDREFNDIVTEARARIPLYCPEWTDHNLSDPGITLIELFAWMTDIVLYRLNRVPDKHYIKFMELIGIRLLGAEAARAPITFWLTAPQPNPISIPDGTEAATTRTSTEEAVSFTTDLPAEIKVPELKYILTSSGEADARSFTTHNVNALLAGSSEVDVFGAPPTTNDAIYFGFDQDLSQHILGLELDLRAAEGAGVDPNNPPYQFEVLGQEANQGWVKIEVDRDSTRALNASGLIRVFLPTLRRAVRSDINAYWVRCRLQVEEGQVNYGVSPTIRRIRAASWGITVESTNLTTVKNEILGRSDGTPGQVFFLTYTPVIARTANEYVMVRTDDGREERWYEVADFAASTPDDRHYTLDSQTGEVRFGPALPQRDGTIRRYGAIPAQNAGIVMTGYRYGGGLKGNVAAGAINILKSALPYIAKIANRRSAAGGRNNENLEDAKIRVPGYLRALDRAVTAADFEELTRRAAPGQVGRVYCLQPPITQRGEIKVMVIPAIPRLEGFISPESLNLSDDLQRTIIAYLDERRLISTQLEVLSPAFQWVETEVRFRPARHADVEQVRSDIEASLFRFLNPLTGGQEGKGWPFGRDLFVGDVMSVLLKVQGVDFVRSVRLFPVAYDNGEFVRGVEVQELPIVAHGVIVSYRHTIRTE
jgi:predicted phage baseplate assembly protein